MSHARGSEALSPSVPSSTPSCTCSPLSPKLVLCSSRLGLEMSLMAGETPSPSANAKLVCLLSPLLPCTIRPPLIHPSIVFRVLFNRGPSSTITEPPPFFHDLATSSRTFSAVPSSRHPDPQCLPTNVAKDCNAGELNVRLCFFVNVRKARGRKDGGGSKIGKMVDIVGLNAG